MKVKVRHDDCPVTTRTQKFGVKVYSYPSTWYPKQGEKRATTICFLQGPPEGKTAFLNDFAKDRLVSRLETEGDMFTYEYRIGKGGQHVQLYYNNKMVFVEPVENSSDGFEYWHVASWEKQVLSRFYRDLVKNMSHCEILSLKESKLSNVYFPNVMPKLSPSQLKAVSLALENGYYQYPRKTSLKKLAVIAGVALSTFQENLRKAEITLLPRVIEHYVKNNAERELLIKTRLKREARTTA